MNQPRIYLLSSMALFASLTIGFGQTCENCGIGTNTPQSSLEIKGCGNDGNTSSLNVTNSDGNSMLYVQDNGQVGIGTSTPVNGYEFFIYRNMPNTDLTMGILNESTTAASSSLVIGNGASFDRYGMIQSINNDFRIINEGDPNSTLSFYTRGASGGGVQQMQIKGNGALELINGNATMTLKHTGSNRQMVLNPSSGYFDITGSNLLLNRYSSTNVILASGGGNVGIGTEGPSEVLTIEHEQPIIKLKDTDGTGIGQQGLIGFYDQNNAQTGWLGYAESANSNLFVQNTTGKIITRTNSSTGGYTTLTPDGNFGVGTYAPGTKLHVEDDVEVRLRLQETGGANMDFIQQSSASSISTTNELRIYTNGSEQFRINNTGNVGIGTTSPSEKLHVDGNVKVSGGQIKVNTANSSTSFSTYNTSATGAPEQFTIMHNYGDVTLENKRGDLYLKASGQIKSEKHIKVNSGGFEVVTPGNGVYMHSPNGTRYLLTVDDSGNLTVVVAP